MTAGPKYEYRWADGVKVGAHMLRINQVTAQPFSRVQKQVYEPAPEQSGEEFEHLALA